MATIGFLTPYKHLPNFCKSIKGRFKDLNLKDIKRNDIKIFQGIDYLFAAPNYLNYILEEEDIEGMNLKGIFTSLNIFSHMLYSIFPNLPYPKIPKVLVLSSSILSEFLTNDNIRNKLCSAVEVISSSIESFFILYIGLDVILI